MTPRLAKAYALLFDAANRLVIARRGSVDMDLVRAVMAVLDAKAKGPSLSKAKCVACGVTFTRPAKELEERRRRSPKGIYCSRSCQVGARNKARNKSKEKK